MQQPSRFPPPHDWRSIDAEIAESGGCVATGLVDAETVDRLNAEADQLLQATPTLGRPSTGSDAYDDFLGHQTVRLHGLIAKLPSAAELIARPEIVDWAERLMTAATAGIQLNAAEFIQIQPGETEQYRHRDSDSWPMVTLTPDPFVVNAIVALDRTTEANGATWVAPGSHRWDRARKPADDEWSRAELAPGDGLLFRGDVIHRGGANRTDRRRRVISLSYCAGWLRPVENSFLNLDRHLVATLEPRLQALLGYRAHKDYAGGTIGLYENGDPARVLPGPGTADSTSS